ncbi:MAG: FAD-dependent oxidoreductase [Pseudomonadota bacterium]
MKIAIIGAGIAGLTAARRLSPNHEVILFDKSRGVGGRMSTRYAGDYEFDHGAQYFTVTDPEFQALMDKEAKKGEVSRWKSRGFYLKTGELTADTGRNRWVGMPRMNRLPKSLAEGLTIELGRRVSEISGTAGNVWLGFEDGANEGPFDRVICTAPALQASDLIAVDSSLQPALTSVKMQACFALMVGWPEPFDAGWDTLRVSNLPISWLALNHAKPGRKEGVSTLMVHAAPDWSDEHAESDRDWVQSVMLEAASALCGRKLDQAPHIALHRWLYAFSDEGVGQDCLVDEEAGLVLAGDWCVGGRVEGAFISGRAAANAINRA